MNLNSLEIIYPTLAGLFKNSPLEPHNIDFDLPYQNIGFMTKSSKKIKRKCIKCKCLLTFIYKLIIHIIYILGITLLQSNCLNIRKIYCCIFFILIMESWR